MHIGRGLYYGSYRTPRVAVWTIGVIILILMMAIAFLGYVLPYGQMSLWGMDISIFILNILNTFKCGLGHIMLSNQFNSIPIQSGNKPDKNFMAMFIGFMDGDGYFDIGEQKQYNKITKSLVKSTIRIRLATNVHNRDLSLLEYFVQILGVGKISNMSSANIFCFSKKYNCAREREQVRVIFSKKDLVTVILPLIKEYNLQFLTSQRV